MKNSILALGALLLVGTGMVSCKKDYTCKCTKTYTSGSTTTTSDYSVYTYKDTKTKADSRCEANATTGSDLSGNYTVNCAIQ